MTKRVLEIVSRQLDLMPIGERYLFRFAYSELRHAWDKARDHMNLTLDKGFTLHVCRHTCASRLVQAGITLPVVMNWLGHADIQTTMRYSHLYPQDLMRAAEALERRIT